MNVITLRKCACIFVSIVVIVVSAAAMQSGGAGSTNPELEARTHFGWVDIYADSNDQPLGAYQLEFTLINNNTKIVGIEGGEKGVFSEPPYYDPEAMQNQRAILAAFTTEKSSQLPTARTRIATIHVQTIGDTPPEYELTLSAAANADGDEISVELTSEQGQGS